MNTCPKCNSPYISKNYLYGILLNSKCMVCNYTKVRKPIKEDNGKYYLYSAKGFKWIEFSPPKENNAV